MSTRKTDGRWETRFGRFLARYGVRALAADLNIHESAIQQWLSGRTSPKVKIGLEIRRLARARGFRASLEQIYSHRKEIQKTGPELAATVIAWRVSRKEYRALAKQTSTNLPGRL
jgi:hypothetical protein